MYVFKSFGIFTSNNNNPTAHFSVKAIYLPLQVTTDSLSTPCFNEMQVNIKTVAAIKAVNVIKTAA